MSILSDVFIFILIFSISNGIANHYLGETRLYRLQQKQESIFSTQKPHINAVIIGDSHARHTIEQPSSIPGLFNYGHYSENYVYHYYRLKKHFEDKNFNIKVAFLQMDPHGFTDDFQYHEYINFMRTIIDPYELGADINRPVFIVFYYKILTELARYSSSLKYHLVDLSKKAPRYIPSPAEELSIKDKEWSDIAMEDRIKLHFGHQDFYPYMKLYFEKIIKLLEDHETKIVLVHFPVTRGYYENIPKKTFREFIEYRTEIMQKYKISGLIDYHDLLFCSDDKLRKLYNDFDHVSPLGRRIATQKFTNDLYSNNLVPTTLQQ